ncbi:MAG: alpha/beta hydrolase [Octadecabacter sp.]
MKQSDLTRRGFMATSSAALMTGCTTRGTFTGPREGTAFTPQRILMATNRAGFDTTDHVDALNFHDINVAVPRNRTTGKVPVNGKDAFGITAHRQLTGTDDIKQALGPIGTAPLVIWIHGFNNTSAEAVYRHAQMVADTELAGPQLSFVWPSIANAGGYLFDRDSALQSRTALQDLFTMLPQIWGGPVTIVAHSLGCMLAMEGLVRMRLQNRPVNVDTLILMQPDISLDVFATQVADISPLPENALLVVSDRDPALRLSARLAQATDRVGTAVDDIASFETMGFQVIDLTSVTDADDNHLVALTSPTVLAAMRDINLGR